MTDFFAGTRTLGAGFGMLMRAPKLLFLGAIPALISVLLLLSVWVALPFVLDDLVRWLTPFAEQWAAWIRDALRVIFGVALFAGAVLVSSLSFIALTLLIGGPFYEHIAERVEEELGLDRSDDGVGWFRSLVRGLVDSVKLVTIALLGAILLFCLGFIPLLGQTVVPVVAALFGSWILTLEMVGLVFLRRGMRLGARHRTLRQHRMLVIGFGLPAYLLCLIPIAQLIVIPAAVVGGTMLAHRILGPATALRTDPT